MERNREGRRSNMAASTGLSRRRQNRLTTTLRDSPEDVQMLRDRSKDRDRDSLNNNNNIRSSKRRRGNKEDGGETTEDEGDYEMEAAGTSRNATTISFSSVLPNRKSVPPSRPVARQQLHPFKVADEMIGVSVPRKARSAACGKRSHESWVSGNGSGFGEEMNHLRASSSPTASRSAEAVSPSSSNISKPSGLKIRTLKAPKSSCLVVQEDIEIEIAEILYGLMKQSEGFKMEDNTDNSLHKLDESKKDTNGLKENKMEVDPASAQTSLISCSVKDESEQPAEMELLALKSEKISGLDVVGDSKATSGSPELQEGAIKQGGSKSAIEEYGEKSVLPLPSKEESAWYTKPDVDFQDSTVTKVNSNVSQAEGQREEKFKIDLMAPPSPERDGYFESCSHPKSKPRHVHLGTENTDKDEEKLDRLVKKKSRVVELEDNNIKAIEEKSEFRLNIEKVNHDNSNDDSSKLQQKQPKATSSKLETTARSNSVHLPVALAGWPSDLPFLGYMPPFQPLLPLDGTNGSTAALQPPRYLLSQTRPKRCVIHHYIARNISLHQQYTKLNQFWPVASSSSPLCGTKINNASALPSMENMISGNSLQGSCPVANTNFVQDKGQVAANFPALTKKDKRAGKANLVDTAQKKQLVLQQPPQPAPAGNLLIFSLTQHQAPVAVTGSQIGFAKSPASTNNTALSGNPITGVATNSSSLPAEAVAVSYNYPNPSTSEAPYLTILPDNGYSFPISTPIANPTVFRGGNSAPALPVYNGSFYSPQLLHPSQLQQSHSQSFDQPAHQNGSSSTGSSLSHKQQQTQQSHGAQVSGNNLFTSSSAPSQQQQKQHALSHQTHKLKNEMSGEITLTITDTRTSHSQKLVHGQNFVVPLQPNFALVSSTTIGGSGSANRCEKQQQQQSQEKGLKGGVEIVPAQAFALSFGSFSGSNTASKLNFSATAQNPVILQSLPDMTRQGYQVVSTPQSTHKKNHQLSEGKSGHSGINPDDVKKGILGKSPGIEQILVFDNSAITGNWPPCSITSTTNSAIAVNSSNSQRHQLLQLQKQHVLHQQQQHHNGGARNKAQISNSLSSSSISSKLSNNGPIFSQGLAQSSSSVPNPQWTNLPKTSMTRAPVSSLTVSNISTLKNVTHQQGRVQQSQISFGRNSKSNLAPHGQQIPLSSHFTSLLVASTPTSNSNLRTTTNNKAANSSVPAMQSQQSDNSSTGNGQKSSPVCGRNVPSILSACPSHLSELK